MYRYTACGGDRSRSGNPTRFALTDHSSDVSEAVSTRIHVHTRTRTRQHAYVHAHAHTRRRRTSKVSVIMDY